MTRSAMIGQRRRLGRLCHLRPKLAKDRPMIRMSGETASRMPPARCLRWRGDWALSSGRARSFRPGRSETLALLARSLGHGQAGLLPRCEAAVHLEDGFEPHLLGDVRREGGAPGAVAVEDEALARSEDVLVVGAVGIDPELEHAARAMEGAGDHAFPLQLPHVAQVHEGHVIAAVAGARFLETEGGDAGLRLVHELPKSLLELHDVLLFGWRSPHSTPGRLAALSHGSALAIPFASDWSFWVETTTALEELEGRYHVVSLAFYFLRFRRKPMPPSRAAPDARSVTVPGSGTRTRGVTWALPGSMKRTASAIRVISSP